MLHGPAGLEAVQLIRFESVGVLICPVKQTTLAHGMRMLDPGFPDHFQHVLGSLTVCRLGRQAVQREVSNTGSVSHSQPHPPLQVDYQRVCLYRLTPHIHPKQQYMM